MHLGVGKFNELKLYCNCSIINYQWVLVDPSQKGVLLIPRSLSTIMSFPLGWFFYFQDQGTIVKLKRQQLLKIMLLFLPICSFPSGFPRKQTKNSVRVSPQQFWILLRFSSISQTEPTLLRCNHCLENFMWPRDIWN